MKYLFKMIFRLLLVLLFVGTGLIASMIYFAVEDIALVGRQPQLQQTDLQQIQQLISANRPDLNKFERPKQIVLSVQNLNQLVQYTSQKILPEMNGRVVLEKRLIYVAMTYVIPANNPLKYLGSYLNVRAEFVTLGGNELDLRNVKIGRIAVPNVIMAYLQPDLLLLIKKQFGGFVKLYQMIDSIQVSREQLLVNYKIQKETIKETLQEIKQLGNELVITDEIRERVLAYSAEIHRISLSLAKVSDQQSFSVTALLKPMFLFAKQRSEHYGQPVEENRVLLLTLGAFITGRNPAQYVSDGKYERFIKLRMNLQGRRDLVQHYLISAAIAAVADQSWANAIGLQKEINDSNGGSGFSFSDLMADKAGTLLAQTALASEQKAMTLQNTMAELVNEDQVLPSVSNLPDGLTATEFKLRYKNTSSYEYQSMLREIERRLASSAMYR